MFQFPGFPRHTLWIHVCVTGLPPAVFPHSDIKGSMPACGSPLLFAACHVLHRRLVPWHPPCALIRLIFLSEFLLRRVFKYSGSIAFPVLFFQLVFQDFFLVFLQLCSCQDAPGIAPLQVSFQNPENDTEERDFCQSFLRIFSASRTFVRFLFLYGFRRNRP